MLVPVESFASVLNLTPSTSPANRTRALTLLLSFCTTIAPLSAQRVVALLERYWRAALPRLQRSDHRQRVLFPVLLILDLWPAREVSVTVNDSARGCGMRQEAVDVKIGGEL